MRRLTAYAILCLAAIAGGGSLIIFVIFLWEPLSLLKLGLDQRGVLWFDAGLSFLFFVQHSGMMRRSARRFVVRFIPKQYEFALYAIVSGMVLLAVTLFWQGGAHTLISFQSIPRWSLHVLFLLSLAGLMWSSLAFQSFDPFGLRPIVDHLRGRIPIPMPMEVRGPYLLVRHPMYLFQILMLWSCPDLTADRLLLDVLWTLWIVVGAFLEERDLLVRFGDRYREYQRKVPMFIPCRIR